MSLFQKAINNDFENLSFDEILEIFPLIFYSVEDIEGFISNLNLNIYQAAKLLELANTITGYITQVPFHSILADAAKHQQANKGTGYNMLGDMKFTYICNEFDNASNPERKFRIVLNEISELLDLVENIRNSFGFSKNELINNLTFHPEIKTIICVLIHEKPLLWSISYMVKGLLHCETGLNLIKCLALNFPHQWHTVCYALIESANKIQNVEASKLEFVINAIKVILELNPSQIYSIFEHCINNKVLPQLVLNVAIDFNKNNELCILDFLKSILIDEGHETCQWFSHYIKNIRTPYLLIISLENKITDMVKSLIVLADSQPDSLDYLMKSQILLKVLAALKSFAGFRFQPELSRLLLQLITHDFPITKPTVDFIQVSMAFVISMGVNFTFENRHSTIMDETISRWLNELIVKQEKFNAKLQNSYSELLLLIALFYHTKQLGEISRIISPILGGKIHDIQPSVNHFRKVFTNDVFTEQVLTSQAAGVPVTKNLNSNKTGHLPIDCVVQLLNLRSFSKNKVKINNWIFRQICNSTVPLHPKLPLLINSFIESLFVTDVKNCQPNEPIAEIDIVSLFDTNPIHSMVACCPNYKSMMHQQQTIVNSSTQDLTPQLLILYYLLSFYDLHCKQLRDGGCISPCFKRSTKFFYSSIWQRIPMKYLIVYMEQNVPNYPGLFPAFLRLVMSLFPQLVCGDYMIQDSFLMEGKLLGGPKTKELPSLEDLETEFQRYVQSNGHECYTIVKFAQFLATTTSAENLIPYADITIDHIHRLLNLIDSVDHSVHYRLLNSYKAIWIKLRVIMPQRIEISTINILQQSEVMENNFLSMVRGSVKPNYTEEQIIENFVEILLINVDKRVFRCVPVLEILLRIIDSTIRSTQTYWYTVQIHSDFNGLLQNQPKKLEAMVMDNTRTTATELEALRMTLLRTQEATIIQLLLEKCLPSDIEIDDCRLAALTEVQRVICSFIHSMFIRDQELCYLVHQQTYPQRLLPVAVQGIPSIHICLNSIETEFVNCGDLYKMVFFLDLISYIGMFYNVTMAIDIATKLLDIFQAVVHSIANIEERPVIIWASVDAVVRIGRTFPNLLSTVTVFLLTAASLCFSFVGLNDDYLHPFDVQDIDKITDQQFDRFDLDEQYQCCYKKLVNAYDGMVRQGIVQSPLYHCR